MNSTDPDAPQPLIGRDDPDPGFWALSAYENPWSRGRRNSHNNDTTLFQLRQNNLSREPGLRESRATYDGPRFYRAVGSKTENVEALLAQSTGPKVPPGEECDSCNWKLGPFVSCVIVPGVLTECANCHWSQQGHRCSFISNRPETRFNRPQRNLAQELEELRVAREEAMAKVYRLDREIEQIERILQGSESGSRVN